LSKLWLCTSLASRCHDNNLGLFLN